MTASIPASWYASKHVADSLASVFAEGRVHARRWALTARTGRRILLPAAASNAACHSSTTPFSHLCRFELKGGGGAVGARSIVTGSDPELASSDRVSFGSSKDQTARDVRVEQTRASIQPRFAASRPREIKEVGEPTPASTAARAAVPSAQEEVPG